MLGALNNPWIVGGGVVIAAFAAYWALVPRDAAPDTGLGDVPVSMGLGGPFYGAPSGLSVSPTSDGGGGTAALADSYARTRSAEIDLEKSRLQTLENVSLAAQMTDRFIADTQASTERTRIAAGFAGEQLKISGVTGAYLNVTGNNGQDTTISAVRTGTWNDAAAANPYSRVIPPTPRDVSPSGAAATGYTASATTVASPSYQASAVSSRVARSAALGYL